MKSFGQSLLVLVYVFVGIVSFNGRIEVGLFGLKGPLFHLLEVAFGVSLLASVFALDHLKYRQHVRHLVAVASDVLKESTT